MGKEIEMKFRLRDEAQAEEILRHPFILGAICADFKEIEMDAVYLDTPDRALAHSGISLRRRREGRDTVFTVKTGLVSRGALSERGEWQVQAEDMDIALCRLREQDAPQEVFDILAHKAVVPCARTRFIRRCAPLAFGAELCVDVGELGTAPFAELEIELSHGTMDELIAFVVRCAELFGLEPETRSKFYRAQLSFCEKGE